MRKELKKIEEALSRNGWILSVPAKGDEETEFVKAFDNGKNVVGIDIALEPESLSGYGHYGVCCVKLVKFEAEMPYIRDDFRTMMELVIEAEKDLLNAEIPFRPTYGFGTALEYNLGRNHELRRKYKLNELEEEDFYRG